MQTDDSEALQLALLQELNDIDGVRGVSTSLINDEEIFLIHITEDCATKVQNRLEGIPELPPWRLVTI